MLHETLSLRRRRKRRGIRIGRRRERMRMGRRGIKMERRMGRRRGRGKECNNSPQILVTEG